MSRWVSSTYQQHRCTYNWHTFPDINIYVKYLPISFIFVCGMGVLHVCHSTCMEVRDQHFRVLCFLLPCGFWGLSSGARLGSKHPYLLNYLTSCEIFEMVLIK